MFNQKSECTITTKYFLYFCKPIYGLQTKKKKTLQLHFVKYRILYIIIFVWCRF